MGLAGLSSTSGSRLPGLQPGLYLVWKGWASLVPQQAELRRETLGWPPPHACPPGQQGHLGSALGSLRPEGPGFQRQEAAWAGAATCEGETGTHPTPPPPTAGDSRPSSAGFPAGCCGLLAKVNLTSGRGRLGKAISPAPRPSPALMSVGAANSPARNP